MFIDEWFEKDYFRELALDYRNNFVFGQIFCTHAYYPHENLEFWRPVPSLGEPTRTIASHFQLQAAGKDAFNRAYPLHAPKLETNEEFIVIRAKKRPVILLQQDVSIEGLDNAGFRGRLQRHLFLVAQLFGLSDAKTGRVEFNPSIIERVRKMEFPELMFVPRLLGVLELDSMLRLDEVQSVFRANLEPTKYALSEHVCEILRYQFEYLISKRAPSPYTELREMLLND